MTMLYLQIQRDIDSMPRGIVVINLVNNRTKPGFKWGFILNFFSQNNVVLVLKN
jgi:hypothetical protein